MAQSPLAAQKFKYERTTSGSITTLVMHGVLDEGFEGKKIAESLRTKKVVLDLRDVRRFASWGMAAWSEFIKVSAGRDIYVAESSASALGQFNLVTGLLGHAKLVSFFVPYRCGTCGEESDSLVLIPTHPEDLTLTEKECPACGGTARIDKFSAQMCSVVAERPSFDIDDEVVAYLRDRYKYDLTPDVGRFRAGARTQKGGVYLKLSGNIAGLRPEAVFASARDTTVVDLAAINPGPYDGKVLAAWRTFVTAALPQVAALELLDCPPGFLEHGVTVDNLTKLKVRSFALPYLCGECNTTTVQMIDVAATLEHLIEGNLPTVRCSTCKVTVESHPSPELAALIRRLPVRAPDAALDKLIEKSRQDPGKLEDALEEKAAAPTAKTAGAQTRALYVVAGLMSVVTIGLILVGVGVWRDKPRVTGAEDTVIAPRTTQQFKRPDWIVSDVPSSGYCQDLINRLMCVGVSAYQQRREDGVAEATDAALEELVNTVGLKISEPMFKDGVLRRVTEARNKALAALQIAEVDRKSKEYAAAIAVARGARRRVVEAFLASGGPAVPAQRSDWYWEEYELEGGRGTEVLVFIRYDIQLDAVKALVERYAGSTDVLGSSTMTVFPGLGWPRPAIATGVLVTSAGGALASAGVASQDVITKVGDTRVVDAPGLARRIAEAPAGSPLSLAVLPTTGPDKTVALPR